MNKDAATAADEPGNIAMEVDACIRRNPAATALVEWDRKGNERSLDFAAFGARTAALAAGLARAGVAKGDRVLLLVPMGIDLYVSILAVIRMGAVCVFVDPNLGAKRFEACCASVRPKAFIGIAKGHLFRLLCPSLRKVPIHITTRGLPGWLALGMDSLIRKNLGGAHAGPVAVAPEDPALISFTTGSSGHPKGSNRTHGFLRCQLEALQDPRKAACASDFPGFPILPLENLARGRVTYIPALEAGKVREAGAKVVKQLAAWRPEMMSGSPAYLEAVADCALASRTEFTSVKALFTGGAPITAKALEKLTRVWTRAEIAVVYGSTEAEPVAALDADELLRECLPLSLRGLGFCVGYPIASLHVIIVPLDFHSHECGDLAEVALGAGRVGEITVRGPHVNTGYWNNSAGERSNKVSTRAGVWHRMGDAGYFDAAGRLWVVGRVHTAMANPHYRPDAESKPAPASWPCIFPYQVECMADEYPYVRKSAYLEAMGAHWVVVERVRGKATDPQLAAAIRSSLADFPVAGVRFMDKLPVDPRHNSKVEYAQVRAWLVAQTEKEISR